MDEVDLAFVESFRERAITDTGAFGMPGFLAIITWIGEDGSLKYRVYNQLDQPLSSCLGMLQLASINLVERCREAEADDS